MAGFVAKGTRPWRESHGRERRNSRHLVEVGFLAAARLYRRPDRVDRDDHFHADGVGGLVRVLFVSPW